MVRLGRCEGVDERIDAIARVGDDPKPPKLLPLETESSDSDRLRLRFMVVRYLKSSMALRGCVLERARGRSSYEKMGIETV